MTKRPESEDQVGYQVDAGSKFYDSLTRRDALKASLGAGALFMVGGGILGCGSSGSGTAGSTAAAVGPRKRGGTLKVAIVSSTSDVIDPHIGTSTTIASFTYAKNLYDGLLRLDHQYQARPALAEEVSSSDGAKKWTVRLRDEIFFHDGRPVTLDDVIFSLRRIINPKNGASNATVLAAVDPNGFRKLDQRTLEINLKYPDVNIENALASPASGIIPPDFDVKNPIGAGAFSLKSFNPGSQVSFERFDDYYNNGLPYLDELTFVAFSDESATVNALQSGAVDGSGNLGPQQVAIAQQNPDVQVVESRTSYIDQIVMQSNAGVFADPQVRLAMKYMVNRQQFVENVYGGYGRVANDLPAIQDPMYAHDIPQREYDPEKAKALLKKAGAENLTVTFTTSPGDQFLVPSAEVFAEQAKEIGWNVKVEKINDVGQYFSKYYAQTELQQDFIVTTTLPRIIGLSLLPDSPYNSSHWTNPRFAKLVDEARGTVPVGRRKELYHEAQQIMYDEGPWVIWGFLNTNDALSKKFTGIVPDVSGGGINGGYFDEISLAV